MSRKYKTSDQDVRYALWLAYKGKDFYSNQKIDFENMEIDHIIPQNIFTDEMKRKQLFDALELPEDFGKDSLVNYAPTCRNINKIKGSDDNIPFLHLALERAKGNEHTVLEYIDKINNSDRNITDAIELSINKTPEEKNQMIDIILDETQEFEQEEEIEGRYYYRSIKKIKLISQMPCIENMKPDCTFMFRSLKLRGFSVRVGHDEMISSLFVGRERFEKLEDRPFICKEYGKDTYNISLGKCNIILTESETIELCQIIDRYIQLYLEARESVEKQYSFEGMKINEFGEIELCKISPATCQLIFDFIMDKNKEKEWNLFEFNDKIIKVFTDDTNKNYNYGYHAIIMPRASLTSSFWDDEAEVTLCLKNNFTDLYSKVSERDWWAPLYVKKWVINILIPKCIEYSICKQRKKSGLLTSE